MHETPPEIEKQLRELYAKLTPEERLLMACRMRNTGIALLKAGILHQHPDISENDMRWEIFLRLYSDCYTVEELARIRPYLSQYNDSQQNKPLPTKV